MGPWSQDLEVAPQQTLNGNKVNHVSEGDGRATSLEQQRKNERQWDYVHPRDTRPPICGTLNILYNLCATQC